MPKQPTVHLVAPALPAAPPQKPHSWGDSKMLPSKNVTLSKRLWKRVKTTIPTWDINVNPLEFE